VIRHATVAAFLFVLSCSGVQAQTGTPSRPESSPGVSLRAVEVDRERTQGKTIVTYNLYATGLPVDKQYVLLVQNVGSEPQPAASALIANDGKVVSTREDRAHGVAEDPINLKIFAGKGEPKTFVVAAEDEKQGVVRVVPFPISAKSGKCQADAVMLQANYSAVQVLASGFQPKEEITVTTQSAGEGGQQHSTATDDGKSNNLFFPLVKGKRSGQLTVDMVAKSCELKLAIPWGEGSYQIQ
jgi:hypothetical protein